MFTALLTPAVDGNNCELQAPSGLPPEKVGLVIECPPVLVLMLSGRRKTLAFAANRSIIRRTFNL